MGKNRYYISTAKTKDKSIFIYYHLDKNPSQFGWGYVG